MLPGKSRPHPAAPVRFLRELSLQTLSGYIAAATQIVRGVVLAGALGPAGLGILTTVAIVLSYSQYCDLGVAQAVSREIPLSAGREREDVHSWIWHAFVAKLVTSAGVGTVLFAVALTRVSAADGDLRFGLAVASVLVVLQGIAAVQLNVFLARRRFGVAAAATVANAGTSLVLGIAAALLVGVKGVFVSQVLALAVTVLVGLTVDGLPKVEPLERDRFRTLLRVGFPLAVLTFVGYNLIWVDQVMVGLLFSRQALGLYTLVMYAGSAMYLLPAALAAVVSPRLISRYGQTADSMAIANLTWRPVRALSLVLPLMIVGVWIVAPAVIREFLPAYEDVIAPLRVYSVGMFFLCLNLGVSSTLVALDKHRYNIPVVASATIINVLLDLAFVKELGWGLTSIALGSALTYLFYWAAHMTLVRHYFGSGIMRSLRSNAASGWPGFVLLGVTLLAAWGHVLSEQSVRFDVFLLVGVVAVTYARWRLSAERASRLDSSRET